MAANLPTRFDDMDVVHSLAYGPEPSQKLDIYIPADAIDKKLDVIVFFYGGRWTYGAKADYRFVGAAFAEKDFIVVIPDYRKYPQVRFPVFVEDGAKALAWVYDNIATYHGNPERIHVAGHSAGAHIGALLAADAHYLGNEGKNRSLVIHDFAGLAGPYAFTPGEPDLEDMFGPPKNYPDMRVTTFVDGKQPPMLLLYGDADTTVKYANIDKLKQRIKKSGGCVQTKIYHDVDHIGLLGALSWFNPQGASVGQDLSKFYNSSTQKRSDLMCTQVKK
ncbi:MAG: esterase [Hyphomicrobiales bacterium]|nr:MAG: esterase [Hyphomicrobiales bacterium]